MTIPIYFVWHVFFGLLVWVRSGFQPQTQIYWRDDDTVERTNLGRLAALCQIFATAWMLAKCRSWSTNLVIYGEDVRAVKTGTVVRFVNDPETAEFYEPSGIDRCDD